jgi:hypothetical protein
MEIPPETAYTKKPEEGQLGVAVSIGRARRTVCLPLLLGFENIQGCVNLREILNPVGRPLDATPHIEDQHHGRSEERVLCT